MKMQTHVRVDLEVGCIYTMWLRQWHWLGYLCLCGSVCVLVFVCLWLLLFWCCVCVSVCVCVRLSYDFANAKKNKSARKPNSNFQN